MGGAGSRGPWRDEPEANVLCSKQGSMVCSWEGKDGGDKNIPHSIYSSYFILLFLITSTSIYLNILSKNGDIVDSCLIF